MRSISADLLAKIQKSQQTIYQNANPKLKVLLSKGFRKDLFRVYTIHNDELLESLDVAVRRMDTLGKPNKVYVAYIKDGIGHVKSKDLPYDETLPWDYGFQIGSASQVAIEFDGYWEREGTSGRWNLITGEYPYIFKVVAGTLTVQLWNGSPITLATGVSKISAVRGWRPSNGHATSDQGLIIAYIKTDGSVWYRTYALQIGDFQAWEPERQIAEFTKTTVDISTFRTNDFRVGFVVQNSDNTVELLVTTRNWAGMSIEPEYIQGQVTSDIQFIPIEFIETNENETILGDVKVSEFEFCHYLIPEPEVVAVNRISETVLELEFNLDLYEYTQDLSVWTVTNTTTSTVVAVSSILIGGANNKLEITLASSIDESADINITYNDWSSNLRSYADDYCKRLVGGFAVISEGIQPPRDGYANETILGDVTADIKLTALQFSSGYDGDETISGDVTVDIKLWKVDEAPV